MVNTDEMWGYLNEVMGISEQTLKIVSSINGYSRETMTDILYAETGYRSFEQIED